MAEEKAAKVPMQSRAYKTKSLVQVLATVAGLVGLDLDPTDLAAVLAGIEAAYLIVRRYRKGKAAA